MSEAGEPGPDRTGAASSTATAADLRRWVDFGGTWRVQAREEGSVVLALCRCDGGEQVDVMVSADPELLLLADRSVDQQQCER